MPLSFGTWVARSRHFHADLLKKPAQQRGAVTTVCDGETRKVGLSPPDVALLQREWISANLSLFSRPKGDNCRSQGRKGGRGGEYCRPNGNGGLPFHDQGRGLLRFG